MRSVQDEERPPEGIGVVPVGQLVDESSDEFFEGDALLQVGVTGEGEILVLIGRSWVTLDSKKAFHLSAALIRARARSARLLSRHRN